MLSSKRNVALACALSGLAGFVDGIGFLHLGGLFVSFMSGNSTRLGVSIAEMDWSAVREAIGLIVVFVAGAGCGSAIVLGGGETRRTWLLLTEAGLLAVAALCATFGFQGVAVSLLAFAMGLENSVFQMQGTGGLGLTYVTGALVKVGQLIASAFAGGARCRTSFCGRRWWRVRSRVRTPIAASGSTRCGSRRQRRCSSPRSPW